MAVNGSRLPSHVQAAIIFPRRAGSFGFTYYLKLVMVIILTCNSPTLSKDPVDGDEGRDHVKRDVQPRNSSDSGR